MKNTKTTKKTTTRKKEVVVPEPEVKRQSTFDLQMTKFELLHLRDLMSVLLPPDGAQTLSQSLAAAEERTIIESMLWDKVSTLCKKAKLPIGADAPDYIVAPLTPPPLGVFQINQDLQQVEEIADGGFLPGEEQEQEEGG